MRSDLDGTFGELPFELSRLAGGGFLIRSRQSLPPQAGAITDRLDHWAHERPHDVFLAERDGTGRWSRVDFASAQQRTRAIAAGLLRLGVSPERPVAVLAENGIDHALVGLAAMYVDVPFAPISPAYALLSSDFGKLRDIIAALTPGVLYTSDLRRYGKAIAAVVPQTVPVVSSRIDVEPAVPQWVMSLSKLETEARAEDFDSVRKANAAVGPDTVAKVLFTSGSTGIPKGVINTQRMLTANQAMISAWLPFLTREPPVLVDWLPWNHTFGGNHNLGLVLTHGGTLYIDEGKPTPEGIVATVRNLEDISPTIYFNVPRGYEALLQHLAENTALRRSFFRRLRFCFYSGASLAEPLSAALDRLAQAETGRPLLMVTGYGSTETAPASVASTDRTAGPGHIGLPLPGVSLKLLPSGDKLEARIAGANVMSGYWRNPAATAAAFDEDGYYRLGDALQLVSGDAPEKGLRFDGRLAEDFKLATGTWVSVGALRLAALAALAPLARELVLAGHDRDEVTALVFPDIEACKAALSGTLEAAIDAGGVCTAPAVHTLFAKALEPLARPTRGSSNRIVRLALLAEPPSIDAGELTDKGSINQRAVLTNRVDVLAALYGDVDDPRIVRPVN